MQYSNCAICGTNNTIVERKHDPDYIFNQCPVCGRYSYMISDSKEITPQKKDMIAAYLYHNIHLYEKKRDPSYTCLIGTKEQADILKKINPHYCHATLDEMKEFYPKSFVEQIDKILITIYHQTTFPGEQLRFNSAGIKSLLFLRRFNENGNQYCMNAINSQYNQVVSYLHKNRYMQINNLGNGMHIITLMPSGNVRGETLIKEKKYELDVNSYNSLLSSSTDKLKEVFSSDYLSSQIDTMLETQDKNPTEAIGKAKDLIESCCKTILEQRKIVWKSEDNVNQLTGETMRALGIHSKDIQGTSEEDAISKALLSNLQQISQRIAEMRNIGGSGHGKPASFEPLSPKYARLAVGAAIALVKFLWDTHEESLT